MKQFFILGRNPHLSKEEILSYLSARKVKFKELLFESNILILEFYSKINLKIQEFGGVLKIGRINFESSDGNLIKAKKEFQKYLEHEEILPADKFTYSVFGNGDVEILKEKFKTEKKKAVLKHGKRIRMQDGSFEENPKTDYSLLFHFNHAKGGRIYFGRVDQFFDSSAIEKRDMNKPARREFLAISPRLANILINLSGAKKGNTLFDPFCGVGGILQEALIREINCYGRDKDKNAIADAEKNLEWLSSQFPFNSKYFLEVGNSLQAPERNFDAIATETPLGKILKRKPTEKEAQKIIRDFEAFIIPLLRRLKKCKRRDAKIAITLPAIGSKRVNTWDVAEKVGLKIVEGPIFEFRPKQFISREIVTFI